MPGNELADQAAKDASLLDDSSTPVTFKSVCAQINQLTKDPPPEHDLPRRVYAKLSQSKEGLVKTRRDQVLLAKIRSGRTPLFREVKAEWDKTTDPSCPLCNNGPHNLEHWLLQCPGTLSKRRELLGPDHLGRLDVLCSHPTEVVALAMSTLPGAPR